MEIIDKRESVEKREGKNEKGQENPSSFDLESLQIKPLEPIEEIQPIDAITPQDTDDIDTLLFRYMSGVATEQEQQRVLAYLSGSEENRSDYETMCKAADFQKFVEEQQLEEMREEQRKVFQRRFLWVASSVAAVALVCLVVLSVMRTGMFGGGGENYVAENQDNPTVVQSPEQGEGSSEVDRQQDGGSDQDAVKAVEGDQDKGRQPAWQVNEDKNFAEGTEKEGFFVNMVRPSEKVYELAQNAQTVTFSWEAEGAVEQTFLVKDMEGNVLVSESVENTYLKQDFGKYRSYGSLTWELNVKFRDGSRKQESGTLKFK